MEKRREIDRVNVTLCILVMLIHILSKAVSALDRRSLQFAAVFVPSRLSSFVVQGFIFLSAAKYFMKYCDGGFNYGSFLKSRIKTVVLPYVLWNVIYYLALIPLGYFIFNPAELAGYILKGNMISHFYFVVVIVQFYLLMPFWLWLVKRADARIMIPMSLVIMIAFGQYIAPGWRYNDRIFLKYIFYWICGCYAGANYKAFAEGLKKYFRAILCIFVAIAVTDAALTLINASGIRYIGGLENIHIAYCTAAIMCTFGIFLWKSKKTDIGLFNVINRQSYNIYLSHCLFLYYADWFAAGHLQVGNAGLLLFRGAVCLGMTFVLWGAYDCIKRLKNA